MKKIICFVKNTINCYITLCQDVTKIIEKYQTFLLNGIYKSNKSGNIIYNKKFKRYALIESGFLWRENVERKHARFSLSEKVGGMLFGLFYKKIIKQENTLGLGHVLTMPTSGSDIKILNYNDYTFCTIFSSRQRMDYVLNNYYVWNKCFVCSGEGRCVPLVEINDNRMYIKEKLIKKIPYEHEQGFNFIFKNIVDSFSFNAAQIERYTLDENDLKVIETYLKSFCNNRADLMLSNLKNFIDKGYYKKCICHGDLYYNNVLFDGFNFYYIDFERLKKHFFIYDILFYVFAESFMFDNNLLLDNYLNGKYDENIQLIFNANSVPFDKNLKKLYLFIILFEYYGSNTPIQFVDKFLL